MSREYEDGYTVDRPPPRRQSGDMIVKPLEYVYILDETKGQISIIVGPQKMSLAGTDKPVVFNAETNRFDPSDADAAIKPFVSVAKGSYVLLENPAESIAHPNIGTISNLTTLLHGCKINLPGPTYFALWPGQHSTVLAGHNLRSNQYLICRIYDDEAAKENIHAAVIKTQTDTNIEESTKPLTPNEKLLPNESELVIGKLFIIKGIDVSFFIPPNGIEVVPDEKGNYIRAAVTLEQLEYCILLDESGDKRFEHGPQVVFPRPTERFLERSDGVPGKVSSRRFRAIELNEISGIYIKVTAAYRDVTTDQMYEEGEELFITGNEQKIYFPRAEHVLIKYGDHEIHYAVAIPKGDAKYVLNRATGEIKLIAGPAMFLPDPRKEVIVRRILDSNKSQIWFPRNEQVSKYNESLRQAATGPDDEFITERQYSSKRSITEEKAYTEEPSEEYAGDVISRKMKFTKPVSVTIDSKFDGAIKLRPWTGYAVQVVAGDGNRRVVEGPTVLHLAYDEELEKISVSTSVPKNTNHIKEDVYLRILNNRVTDTIQIETSDMVKVDVTVSYRVNFTGDPNKWFNVENYVQHLCDNCRSILRNTGKSRDIQDFYENYINIVRDTIVPVDEETSIRGRLFEENGMLITEVEVLECQITNHRIQEMLENAQLQTAHTLISLNEQKKAFELETAKAKLDSDREELKTETNEMHEIQERIRAEERVRTLVAEHEIELNSATRQSTYEQKLINNKRIAALLKITSETEQQLAEDAAEQARQELLNIINGAKLDRLEAKYEQDRRQQESETTDYISRLKAEAQRAVEESSAVQPGLVEALSALSKAGMLEKITKDIAPLAIVKGLTIGGAISQLFEGTGFEDTIARLTSTVDADKNNSSRPYNMDSPQHKSDKWSD